MKLALRCMMVATVFVFAAVAPATAQEVTPRLNLSHVCNQATGELEVHFVLVQAPPANYVGTAVAYSLRIDGGPVITGTAAYTRQTGDTVHYYAYIGGGATAVEVIAATLVVGDVTYQLANPGTFAAGSCIPASIVLDSFTATCIPDGVRLEWTSSSEILTERYDLWRDALLVATIPAQHPYSAVGASYVYTDTIYPGAFAYTLDGFGWAPETVHVNCAAPTAVTLATFDAGNKLTCKWAVLNTKCICKIGKYWQGMPRSFCR